MVLMRMALLIMVVVTASAFGQSLPNSTQGQLNQKSINVYPGDVPKETPVIYGKPYLVPTLRFRLFKGNTQEPLAGAKISVLYVWHWLQYPYPESPCGSFSSATERTEVESDKDGVVVIPEYTVKPRGWSKQPKCWWWSLTHPNNKKAEPYFDHLEIRISDPQYATGFTYSKSDIEHHRDKVNTVNVPINILRNGYGVPIDKVTGKPIPSPK